SRKFPAYFINPFHQVHTLLPCNQLLMGFAHFYSPFRYLSVPNCLLLTAHCLLAPPLPHRRIVTRRAADTVHRARSVLLAWRLRSANRERLGSHTKCNSELCH